MKPFVRIAGGAARQFMCAKLLAVGYVLAQLVTPSLAQDDSEACVARSRDGDFAVCERAVAIRPGNLELRRHLAFAYLAVNDKDACVRVHQATVALAPSDPAVWLDYAIAMATFWDYRGAVPPIREALRLAPDDREANRIAALIFAAIGDTAAAFDANRRGAELGDIVQMFALADAYARGLGTARDPDAARHWLVRAAEAGHVGAMDRLGESDPEWAERARRARD